MIHESQNLINDKIILNRKIEPITTHQIYQFTQNNQFFVAKVFKPNFRHNFQCQLNILRLLNHQNIIQLVKNVQGNSQSPNKFDMLIFRYAKFGSLNQYIPFYGKFNQQIARVFFKQIISALKYASEIQPNGILHPNLLPSNILLDEKRKIKICGWSKQNLKLTKQEMIKNQIFSSCQILILMITGYPPFLNKQSTADPVYRLVKAKKMNKFWQELTRKVSLKYKGFQFSQQLKELVQKVFLGQWNQFKQIQQANWFKLPTPQLKNLQQILQKKQMHTISKRKQKVEQQFLRAQKKKNLLQRIQNEQNTAYTVRSSNSDCELEYFMNDLNQYFFILNNDVPSSQCSEMIQLFDNRPNYIVATLKQIFAQKEANELNLIFGEELKLEKQYIQRKDNHFIFQLLFDQVDNLNTQNQDETQESIQIKILMQIIFYKTSNHRLFATIKLMNSNLIEFFNKLFINFIQNKIKMVDSSQITLFQE